MLVFYDFETFKYDWLVVLINPIEKTEQVIVNDAKKLEEYYEEHKNSIWIGYNSSRYDQYILKAILCGFNPKVVNDWIIEDGKNGYSFSKQFNKFPLISYDVMTRLDGSLKSKEGFMGNDIRESDVPFNIDRKLTTEEIKETIIYCKHDVEQTIEVFLNRKDDFDAHIGLIKAFNLPISYMNKTKVQLSSIILDAHRVHNRNDEFDISIPNTLHLKKYKHIENWYRNLDNRDYDKKLVVDVAGCEHIFAWGGVHGALPKYYSEGLYIMADVASLYPSLIINYGYMSRNVTDINKYTEIYHTRLKYKAEKNPLQLPLKLLLNGTYGAMKDKFNDLYDPLQANNICVAGQLLLLDLIEKLEEADCCKLIQSNTDGILIKLNSKDDFDKIDDICYEWEKRTHLQLEFDIFTKVYQKDVNNYVLVGADGKVKTKGAYTKKLNKLDYDMPIVNKALVDYMVHDIPIEKTINNCDDLIMYQKIVKLTGKYDFVEHNKIKYDYKCYRVFASKDNLDGQILKCKKVEVCQNYFDGIKRDKFGNTPDSCFIDNSNVNNKKIPNKLNKQWYIDLAYERLRQYGIE